MLKNYLKDIMKKRNISTSQLANETGISRQTISKIKNNPFYNISGQTISELVLFLNIPFDELLTPYTKEDYLMEILSSKKFTDNHLKLLNDILSCHLGFSCKFNAYSSHKRCLNFHSKGRKDLKFSGNIRLSFDSNGFVFNVVDFYLYDMKKSLSFDYLFNFYQQFMLCLESYATTIGFTKILININPYFYKRKSIFMEPSHTNTTDLKTIFNPLNYTDRENELFKTTIIEGLGYLELFSIFDNEKDNQKKRAINHTIYSLSKLTFTEKERKKVQLLNRNKLSASIYTKQYVKLINPEIF